MLQDKEKGKQSKEKTFVQSLTWKSLKVDMRMLKRDSSSVRVRTTGGLELKGSGVCLKSMERLEKKSEGVHFRQLSINWFIVWAWTEAGAGIVRIKYSDVISF